MEKAAATDQDTYKKAAAQKALELVRDGMLVGLGSGSTVRYFTEGVGRLVAEGMRVWGVPTSRATAALAAEYGIPLVAEPSRPIDLAVDGADEIDPRLNLIKGRGGALFREKLVASSAKRFVVIADESKLVNRLGVGVLPVEVLPFLWRTTAARAARVGARWAMRGGEEAPYATDNGNVILDLSLEGGITEPTALALTLKSMTGVVEHGLFLGLTHACIVAGAKGPRVIGELG